MNLIHRSIWNDQTGTFVAVSENTRSAGKRASSCTTAGGQARFGLNILAVSLMMACGASALAQPAGGVVSAGSATIGGTASNMIIHQATPNVAINWQSFGIKAGESVQFVQPGSSSVALNRVIGASPSGIFGSLSSNGKVFLVNPNGILFGRDASVNVGGLVASTLAISDANFMANNFKFSGAGAGAVVNQGTINAADGGYVALLGANVSNEGVIAAKLGTVALAAGNAVTLDMAGDKLLNVTVDQGAVNALVENGGMLRADGGQVLMTTQAAGSLLANAVNNTGVVQAQTLVTGENGTIMLMGGMESGTVNVGGTLDASAPNGGNGGFIETSAAHVVLASNKNITTLASNGKTGMWLLDPVNWQIGNDGAVIGDETPASVTTSLASTDRTIVATNDITVAEAVTWVSPQVLTLDAGHDVLVKAAMTTSGINSGLVLKAVNDVIIDNPLVAPAARELTASALGAKIDISAGRNVTVTTAVTASASGARIGMSAGGNLTVGVITADAGGAVNLSANNDVIVNGMITADTGPNAVILRADNDGSGPGRAAGTVAFGLLGGISTTSAIIRFNPDGYANTASEITAYGSKNTGTMDAKAWVFAQGVSRVYDGTTDATLEFRGTPTLGGAVTLNGSVANFTDNKNVGVNKPIAYSGYTLTGTDQGRFDLFAPVGTAAGSGTTTGDVTKRPLTATVAAYNKPYDGTTTAIPVPTLTINPPGTNSGLVGTETLTVTGTGNFNSPDVATANMVTLNNTTLADGANGGLASNYSLASGQTAPAIITPVDLIITAKNDAKPYDAAPYSGGNGVDYDKFVNGEGPGVLGGTLAYGGNSQGAVDVGNYAITPGGLTSTNYNIKPVDGNLLVTAVPLLITANPDSKTYDGAPYIGGNGVIYGAFVGGEGPGVLSGVLNYNGTSQGAVTPGSYAINPLGLTSRNYDISYAPNTLLIRPKPLTGGITAADKPYDANNSATITGRPLAGVVGGDDVTYTGGTATFNNPTAGDGKPVTGTGLGLSGPDAGNYTVNTTATTTASITTVVVTPPVVTPPVEPTPVDTTPVVTTPVDSSTGELTPGDSTTGGLTPLPDTPYEGPTVNPRVIVPTWMPVVTRPVTPPQLLTLAPPAPPIAVPVVEKPVEKLVVQPVAPPPTPYLAPKRQPKQDRN